jgi:hypothetical protein
MPSSEYYRRQADTLLTLALASATDPELSARYRNLAVKYKMLAANGGEDTDAPWSGRDSLSSAAED